MSFNKITSAAVTATAAFLLVACAGKTLRPGESAPLRDQSGRIYGTRLQQSDSVERQIIDADQDGTAEKQYGFKRDVLIYSEHYYPDGKIRIRTSYLNGKPNRSEVFRPDGSLRGVAYHNALNQVDTVDLPSQNRRVEFLPKR